MCCRCVRFNVFSCLVSIAANSCLCARNCACVVWPEQHLNISRAKAADELLAFGAQLEETTRITIKPLAGVPDRTTEGTDGLSRSVEDETLARTAAILFVVCLRGCCRATPHTRKKTLEIYFEIFSRHTRAYLCVCTQRRRHGKLYQVNLNCGLCANARRELACVIYSFARCCAAIRVATATTTWLCTCVRVLVGGGWMCTSACRVCAQDSCGECDLLRSSGTAFAFNCVCVSARVEDIVLSGSRVRYTYREDVCVCVDGALQLCGERASASFGVHKLHWIYVYFWYGVE